MCPFLAVTTDCCVQNSSNSFRFVFPTRYVAFRNAAHESPAHEIFVVCRFFLAIVHGLIAVSKSIVIGVFFFPLSMDAVPDRNGISVGRGRPSPSDVRVEMSELLDIVQSCIHRIFGR